MTRLAGAAEEENDDDDPPDPPEEGAATPVSQGTRYEELLKNPTQDYPTGICSMRKGAVGMQRIHGAEDPAPHLRWSPFHSHLGRPQPPSKRRTPEIKGPRYGHDDSEGRC
ncbi:hypothetical protein CSUB01_04725 [Colletotrichum sublineola]|uniref:Uncharacterized protein n=1 Tax=Colletotrichum sublineola TaxID=1173701 RepID=A0A066XEZ9_COLSU|nr:hypothetical protein CSUB01_04725 [Colletotrichum sublineola]